MVLTQGGLEAGWRVRDVLCVGKGPLHGQVTASAQGHDFGPREIPEGTQQSSQQSLFPVAGGAFLCPERILAWVPGLAAATSTPALHTAHRSLKASWSLVTSLCTGPATPGL
jgi:hypothetical protein